MMFVGDPHVDSRSPDFRNDDYPTTILQKLAWVISYARQHMLLPVFLGDLFNKPRDNPNWILVRLIDLLQGQSAIAVYGNHDCAEPELSDNDSLSVIIQAGCLRLVSATNPWRGTISGRPVLIGGSSYRQSIPQTWNVNRPNSAELFPEPPFVVWLTHHDLTVAGYDAGRIAQTEIEGVDVVVNGHIHTPSDPIRKGRTLWLNPGNIVRLNRSDSSRARRPSVLKIELSPDGFTYEQVEVPHQPFEDVFATPLIDDPGVSDLPSAFIAGLSELRFRRTSSGAGLRSFLEKNLEQFPRSVADEILYLAGAVTGHSV
jgi:hypothetical protein